MENGAPRREPAHGSLGAAGGQPGPSAFCASSSAALASSLPRATARGGKAPQGADDGSGSLNRGRCPADPLSTIQVSKLESLILEKICTLEYVSRVGYIDEGHEEVFILVIYDDDDDRVGEMIRGIGDGGRAIDDEIPDRMFTPVPIQDGPDLPVDILANSKVIYEREARQ